MIKQVVDRATARTPRQRSGVKSRILYLFGDVSPGGGACANEDHNRFTVSQLRNQLGKIQSSMALVSLPELFQPGASGQVASIAFAGGYRGQLDYGLPLLEALAIPGHLFVPIQRLGTPGRIRPRDLALACRGNQIGMELDLTPKFPSSSRQLALLLTNARKVIYRNTGSKPTYIRIIEPSVPAHYRFLLRQFGIHGAVTESGGGHQIDPQFQLIKSSAVSPRNWFNLPIF